MHSKQFVLLAVLFIFCGFAAAQEITFSISFFDYSDSSTFACQVYNSSMTVVYWRQFIFFDYPTAIICVQTIIGCDLQDGFTSVFYYALTWESNSVSVVMNSYEPQSDCLSKPVDINFFTDYDYCFTTTCALYQVGYANKTFAIDDSPMKHPFF